MEGKILGNRYELIEKIGGGGMAVVYKAKCRLLNRFVAIKMLRQEFINDEEFVKRFRIEAQAAASLSHPNIVSIYDVGQENDIHYIVMEYIDGVTLKDYIIKKRKLPWKEAVKIAIQICSAIEHAHRNHIVHRDIKPHNILLTGEGIAKVTDFGIARAVSSSTITMLGSTIGSVHYFSPEQARGGYTDEKSDLYSLGVALYEMVTGRVPFDGETPVAIALKHLQVEAEPPVELDGDIPSGVNTIIMKAMRKEQNKRYQTAAQMLEDLNKVLYEPDAEFAEAVDMNDIPTQRVKAFKSEDYLIKDDYMAKGEKGKRKDEKLTIWLAVATSAILIALFTYIGYKLVVPIVQVEDSQQKEFIVGNYVGKNIDDVKEMLEKEGITVKVDKVSKDGVEAGRIIAQSIVEGKKLKRNGYDSEIKLTVSKGPQLIKIPDLRKKDYRLAEREIRDLGLEPKIEEEYSDIYVTGMIIRTEPGEGEEVKDGSVVVLFKSMGPEIKTAIVPDIVGKTRVEAEKLLSDANLTVGNVFPEDGKNYVDKIVKQHPAANSEVNELSPVDMYFETADDTLRRKIVNVSLALNNANEYGDTINIRVDVTPNDTNRTDNLINETRKKQDFPLTIPVPVPENGNTKVSVYLDGKRFVEFNQD
ncbi:MAG: Stk1 family PASTA domain-containing Ser/Thr kinase [Clostridia bacterium]|nr:Stk1 family PASTA domain-containing Ser/Thr kinase [Clostridia bacterium]